jgi:hypothetical protein
VYDLITTSSCPGAASLRREETVDVSQSGDQLSFPINLGHGEVHGTIHGKTMALAWQESFLVCQNVLTGSGMIDGTSITGQVSGEIKGGSLCSCNGSVLTIAFGMSKH